MWIFGRQANIRRPFPFYLMWLSAIFVRFVQSFFFSIIWKRLKKTQSLLFEFCKVSVKIVVVLFVVVRVVHRDRQWNIFIFDARGSLSTPTWSSSSSSSHRWTTQNLSLYVSPCKCQHCTWSVHVVSEVCLVSMVRGWARHNTQHTDTIRTVVRGWGTDISRE